MSLSGYNTVISSETSDDFVLVPANLPTDKQCHEMNSSPPRPSTLPIQIPKNSSSPKKVRIMFTCDAYLLYIRGPDQYNQRYQISYDECEKNKAA